MNPAILLPLSLIYLCIGILAFLAALRVLPSVLPDQFAVLTFWAALICGVFWILMIIPVILYLIHLSIYRGEHSDEL